MSLQPAVAREVEPPVAASVALGVGRTALTFGCLLAALLISVVLGVALGSVRVPLEETGRTLLWAAHLPVAPPDVAHIAVIYLIRLPRVLAAAIVGMALAVSGAVMQGLFKNPMADPGIIGVSAGGALGGATAIALGWVGPYYAFVSGAAFAGALAASFGVYALATRHGRTPVGTLLLSGVALSSFVGALVSLVLSFTDDAVLRQTMYWLMGNLSGKAWPHVQATGPLIAAGVVGMLAFSRELNLMLMGEETALSRGIDVERTKRRVLVVCALATGVAVSISGIIGFVGLIVPHALRLMLGPDHRLLLPACALGGATFLILADLVSRTVVYPIEIQTGITTALCGAPFFLFLLHRRREEVGGDV